MGIRTASRTLWNACSSSVAAAVVAAAETAAVFQGQPPFSTMAWADQITVWDLSWELPRTATHTKAVHAQAVHAQAVHAQAVHPQAVHPQAVHTQAVHSQPLSMRSARMASATTATFLGQMMLCVDHDAVRDGSIKKE
jgi:hypothetical protein